MLNVRYALENSEFVKIPFIKYVSLASQEPTIQGATRDASPQ
jgi:hypothetical protein